MRRIMQNACKRGLTFVLSLAMVLSLFGSYELTYAASTETGSYLDGTYTGSGTGYAGEGSVKLDVTISGGKITEITTNETTDTDYYYELATSLFQTIIDTQSTDVDTVSGATKSCNGIIEAVENALEQAEDPGIFASGAGTESNPYVIETAEQLLSFASAVDAGETYAGCYVQLGADVDLTGVDWNPIGTEGSVKATDASFFAGTFDGNGYTISNLTLSEEYSSEANVGLFSALGEGATVEDVTLTNVSLDVTDTAGIVRAGGIAGNTVANSAGTYTVINNCSVSGTITATSTAGTMTYAGGLLGYGNAYSIISNATSNADVTGTTNGTISAYAGGIVGMALGTAYVVNTMSTGTITAIATKNTNFGGMAGGVAGMFAGYAYNNYATGDVVIGNAGSAHQWGGILFGEVTTANMTKVDGVYTYDSVDVRAYGYYAASATLQEQTYTDGELSNTETLETVGIGVGTVASDTVYSPSAVSAETTAAEMAETLNGNLYDVYKNLKKLGVEDVVTLQNWEASDDVVTPTGEVWVNTTIDESIFAGGSGTAEDPYQIATAEQLTEFAGSLSEGIDYTDCTIQLTADIDISNQAWSPIGGSDYAFNGTFDGNGYTISGMTMGSAGSPMALDIENIFIGLFGVLEADAVVENVTLTNVGIYTTYTATAYVGGIAGYTAGNTASGTYTGATIDHCSVSGTISHTATAGNNFVAGLVGYMYKGALINSCADVDVTCIITDGNYIAEVAGLVGLNNRGLVANDYSLGNITGSASRDNGDEGMAAVSSLVAVNAGALVNCYAEGDLTASEYSTYVGMVSGWVTGNGKSYNCWFDTSTKMVVNGVTVDPAESIGTKVTSGVNDEGTAYTGGLVDGLASYTADTYASIVDGLNGSYEAFPIDITLYGLSADALSTWTYDEENALVTFASENATVTYSQPECEVYEEEDADLQDGTWYGRDDDKTTVVCIVVENGEITSTTVLSGDTEGDAYEEALDVAKDKSSWGDTTNYEAADTSVFAGGSGTEEDPYQIATEAQLRYLAESINEDVSWEGVYFVQTADITLSDEDWTPIGWALQAKVNGSMTTVAAYPFEGNYDGGGYSISNLCIGTQENPASYYAAGLFGLTSGEYSGNDVQDDSVREVVLQNITLKDVSIYTQAQYATYVGGIVGMAQNGIVMDNCSASGTISTNTSESFSIAGGLCGSALRGYAINCVADVDVTAVTDASAVYAGGAFGMQNRMTAVNCYTLGAVEGTSGNNNKVYVGGFCGQNGGSNINCYVSGNVTSTKTTENAGLFNGRLAGIGVNVACYYDESATLTVAGKSVEAVGNGATVSSAYADLTGVESTTSADFVSLLNENVANIASLLETANTAVENGTSDLSYIIYYAGDGSDLMTWTLKNGIAALSGSLYVAQKTENTESQAAETQETTTVTTATTPTSESTESLSVGDTFKVGKVTYKVTGKNTVTYVKTTSKAKKITVSATVTKNGTTYKVTAIGKNAFKQATKVKTIVIKSTTIKKVGKNAFKTKTLKTVKLAKTRYKATKKLVKKACYSKVKIKKA